MFIEARTVRWPGSRPIWPELLTGETDLAMAWDEKRISGEYRQWHAEQDGLLIFTRQLIESGVATPERVLALDDQVKDEIEGAIQFALDSPEPEPAEAFEGVFA
jgi:pyruvate dehydrogenase E1 component alpha subunit